jgi:hypothetical protein
VPDRDLADRIVATAARLNAAVCHQDVEQVIELVKRQEHLITQARSSGVDCGWTAEQLAAAIDACRQATEFMAKQRLVVNKQIGAAREWRAGLSEYGRHETGNSQVISRC